MRFIYFFILCLLCGVSPLAATQLTFTPPEGWRKAEEKELKDFPSVKAMVIGTTKGSFPPSMCLGAEPYGKPLSEYIETIKATSRSLRSNWKELGKLMTQAGEGHLSQEDITTQWGEIREMHLILYHDGSIYMLTAAASKEEFPQLYSRFFEAMKSLQFIEKEKGD